MGHWRWVAGRGVAGVALVEAPWRALAKETQCRFMAGPTWNRAYARAFSFDVDVRALYFGSHLAAVAAFRAENGSRTLEENEHFPVCDVAVDWSLPGVTEALLDGWMDGQTELMLSRLPADGRLVRTLESVARARGTDVAVCRSQGDAFIPLTGGVETVRSLFSGRAIRHERKLEDSLRALGNVTFQCETRVSQSLLSEAFALEAAGWKGREGVPMVADPATKAFYETLVEFGCPNDEIVLNTLRLDGRMLAFELSCRSGGRMDVLKIGYDEAFAAQSPGNVLRWYVLESEAAKGDITSYHLGRPSRWKTRWATQIEDLASVRLYSGLAGKARYWTSIAPRLWAKENLPEVVSVVRTITGRAAPPAFHPRRPSLAPAALRLVAPPTIDDSPESASAIAVPESGVRRTGEAYEVPAEKKARDAG